MLANLLSLKLSYRVIVDQENVKRKIGRQGYPLGIEHATSGFWVFWDFPSE